MVPATVSVSVRESASLALVARPFGCVSGLRRARPAIVELELLEGKGRHCFHGAHQAWRVVTIGRSW